MVRWLIILAVVITLSVTGLLLETPRGSIDGNLLLQIPNTDNKSTYSIDNIIEKDARVIAYGPVTRVSDVNEKGYFRFNTLPKGTYNLLYKANGYSSTYEWDVSVDEAKVKTVKEIKLNLLSPSLTLSANTNVFMPKEKPYLWFTAANLDEVRLKVYKFDVSKLLDAPKDKKDQYIRILLGNYYYSNDTFVDDITKNLSPVHTFTKKIVYGAEDYSRVPFKIDHKLDKGSYLIIAEGDSSINKKTLKDAYWISVTDLGLIAKHDPKKILFRAVNLETLQPEKDVTVKIYDRYEDQKLIGQAKTDAQGLVEIPYNNNLEKSSTSLFMYGNKGLSNAIVGSYNWFYSDELYKVYTYTDRPVYRPNQKAYFKGIVRYIEGLNLKNYAKKDVRITIKNPDNDIVKTINTKTTEFGTYDGFIEIPEDTKLGNYTILTNIDSNIYNTYFEVAEYRKPEFKVDVIPGAKYVVSNNKTTATVNANYFFGYPVKNAKVKYTVYASPDYSLRWKLEPRPEYFSFFDDWRDDDPHYYSTSGVVVAEGSTQTDDNGEAKISFDTKNMDFDDESFYRDNDSLPQSYRVEAEVTDISRKTVTGNSTFNVVPGNFLLYVQSEHFIYSPNEPIEVSVSAVDFERKRLATDVTLQLQEWQWDSSSYQYVKPKVVASTKVITSANDKVKATIKIPKKSETKDYKVVAIAKDQEGNTITHQDYIWISNYAYDKKDQKLKQSLQIALDKPVYKPGETAKIVINSPIKDINALMTLEGNDVFEYKLLPLTSYSTQIELPLKENYMPNIYISVSVVGKDKQFLEQKKNIYISPEQKFLTVKLKKSQEKYKPRDKVTYDIEVKDDKGNPVSTELSVGVVDESIYTIRPDYTPDIKKFFYNQRYNAVRTAYSFAESYSAGPDKIEPMLRKNFKDTAFWNAFVRTDKNGKATVTFPLPDNLTTWRTTVRAVTKETNVASTIDNILVTKDIIVRLATPRFYTNGDEAVLASIVHNYTDKPQSLRVVLDTPELLQLTDASKKPQAEVNIPAQGQQRTDWNVVASKSGEAKITVKALSSAIEGDAIEKDITVKPFGVPKTQYINNSIGDETDTEVINIDIPDSIDPNSLVWNFEISTNQASMLLGALDYLIEYPYGCTEQTISRFIPAIVVDNAVKTFGLSLNNDTKEDLPKVIKEGLTRIEKLQNNDGGWGWWKYDKSSPYMTSYVLYELHLADKYGHKFNKQDINRALSWIDSHLKNKAIVNISNGEDIDTSSYPEYAETSLTDLCFELYVFSLYGKTNPTILRNLDKNKDKIPNQGLGYLALAYYHRGYMQKAQDIIDLVLSRTDMTTQMLNMGMSMKVLSSFGIDLSSYDFYNDAEISAIVLQALLKVNPESPQADKVADFIIHNRTGRYWENTKTTSQVILAMSDYVRTKTIQAEPDYDLLVNFNDKQIIDVHIDKNNVFKSNIKINIADQDILPKNKIVIKKIGSGKVFYNSDINYYEKYQASETISSVSNKGLTVSKELYTLKPHYNSNGEITYNEISYRGAVKAGEILLVKLTLDAKEPLDYLIIEDPKSSGMEMVSMDPENKLGSDFDKDEPYWWKTWWTHEEDRDSYAAFFVTHLPAGKREIKYLVRPEFPGEYLMRPAVVKSMYAEQVSSSTESAVLKVQE